MKQFDEDSAVLAQSRFQKALVIKCCDQPLAFGKAGGAEEGTRKMGQFIFMPNLRRLFPGQLHPTGAGPTPTGGKVY